MLHLFQLCHPVRRQLHPLTNIPRPRQTKHICLFVPPPVLCCACPCSVHSIMPICPFQNNSEQLDRGNHQSVTRHFLSPSSIFPTPSTPNEVVKGPTQPEVRLHVTPRFERVHLTTPPHWI